MSLSPLVETFVLHFGEMGGRWGVNRTVGQIYALLFLSDRPMNADEVVDALGISRSNVSMGLKELESWRLVKKKHLPRDRRDYFETPADVWDILRILAEERRKREIDPTLSLLRDVLMETPASAQDAFAQTRMRDMHEMIELLTDWAEDVKRLSDTDIRNLLILGSKVVKLLQVKSALVGMGRAETTPSAGA